MPNDAFKLQKLAFAISGLVSFVTLFAIILLRSPSNNQTPSPKTNISNYTPSGVQGNHFKKLSPGLIEVPFTNFLNSLPSHVKLAVNASNGKSRLIFQNGAIVDFQDKPGVPLKIVDLGDKKVVVFREMFANSIYLFVYDHRNKLIDSKELTMPEGVKPIFRQAFSHGDDLVLALYDNSKRINFIERYQIDGGIKQIKFTKLILPSFEDPAGSNYEMMANIFIYPLDSKRYWLAAGSFLGIIGPNKILAEHRIPNCLRVQEFVVIDNIASVFCVNRYGNKHVFSLSTWNPSGSIGTFKQFDGQSIPFNFRFSNGRLLFDSADMTSKLPDLLRFDLQRNHSSGVMEMASSNVEGRVAWSQIYYLNGYLDFLELASKNVSVRSTYQSILPDIKKRLDVEMSLLLLILKSDKGFLTKAFTVDRSPNLFAVQTSRLLLLLNRYHRLINNDNIDPYHLKLFKSVASLSGHIDILAVSDGEEHGLDKGSYYLKWPKGSAFPFDGLNVPYNHQNEWAYSILDSLSIRQFAQELVDVEPVEASFSIIDKFAKDNIVGETFPASGEWPYWWGRAYEGWTEQDAISTNIPSYKGDRSKAFISFKSIDVLSLMSAFDFASEFRHVECSTSYDSMPLDICLHIKTLLGSAQYKYFSGTNFAVKIRSSIARLVRSGQLYPYAAYAIDKAQPDSAFNLYNSAHYSRLNAPWELRNAAWALSGKVEGQR